LSSVIEHFLIISQWPLYKIKTAISGKYQINLAVNTLKFIYKQRFPWTK